MLTSHYTAADLHDPGHLLLALAVLAVTAGATGAHIHAARCGVK